MASSLVPGKPRLTVSLPGTKAGPGIGAVVPVPEVAGPVLSEPAGGRPELDVLAGFDEPDEPDEPGPGPVVAEPLEAGPGVDELDALVPGEASSPPPPQAA
ncbi:MAG: hypothetical protein AB7W59_18110, partial [Acidimicrobiia bacterium]